MKNADSHVYLYAKGHYKEGDLVEDLRKIFGKRNIIEPEHILIGDIAHMLLGIAWPYVNDLYHFENFIQDLSPNNCWKVNCKDKYSFAEAVIRKCLSVLRMTTVKDKDNKTLIELDDPDPGILPLTRYTNKKGDE